MRNSIKLLSVLMVIVTASVLVGCSGDATERLLESDGSGHSGSIPVVSYTLSFEMQGHGTQVAQQHIIRGGLATEPNPAPTASGCVFLGWYKEAGCTNSWVFATDTVTANTTLYAKWGASFPSGVLPGLFSVAAGRTVHFSKGNLQYQASTGTWQFANNQYDCIGNVAGNNTKTERDTQSAWIDLFGWGATGRTDINSCLACPYSAGYTDSAYKTQDPGSSDETLTRDNGGDWGVCMGEGWRTLTIEEWQYLFNYGDYANATRAGLYASGVTVAGKENCIVLYPDGWTREKVDNGDTTSYDTAAEWADVEASGAVCLPAAGSRNDTSVEAVGYDDGHGGGNYWSSTACEAPVDWIYYAYCLSFGTDCLFVSGVGGNYRYYGHSVRLVCDEN